MASVHWEDSMSVGVPMLDIDHRRLVEILARLQNSVGEHSNRELIAATIATLLTYTEEHFRHEEESMERYAYPDAAQHIAEHDDLMRKLQTFKENAERGQTATAIELMDFLGGYLTNHMVGADKKVGLFLRSRLPAEASA